MGFPGNDRETLIEALASAYRARDPHGAITAHPAFYDLDDEGRIEAFAASARLRRLEASPPPPTRCSRASARPAGERRSHRAQAPNRSRDQNVPMALNPT